MAKPITFSVIKADVGGYIGQSFVHPELLDAARERVGEAIEKKLLIDGHVTHCGDDLELIMTYREGVDNAEIHKIAWDVFVACTDIAKRLKLYGAGQDLLAEAFAGTIRGMGPGVAEMEFEERASEPIVVFMADKTSPGAWNLALFQIYANPFNTAGLVIDPATHQGFEFEVIDGFEKRSIRLICPEDMYELLMFIGAPRRYMVKHVYRRKGGEIVASASTQKLSLIAGNYVGKDDPVLIARCQSGFPALGETLEPFTSPHLVEGWMRGSHRGPLMPVSFTQATPSRFDGPPRDCGRLLAERRQTPRTTRSVRRSCLRRRALAGN